jgi:hypothetical protein
MAKNTISSDKIIPVAAVTAAAAAAAAGAYWLYGAKNAAQHRKLVKSWMLNARAEVMDAVGKLQDVDKEKYMEIVNEVVARYAGHATTAEIRQVISDLKDSWNYINKQKGPAKRRARAVKRSTTKVAKRAARATNKRAS